MAIPGGPGPSGPTGKCKYQFDAATNKWNRISGSSLCRPSATVGDPGGPGGQTTPSGTDGQVVEIDCQTGALVPGQVVVGGQIVDAIIDYVFPVFFDDDGEDQTSA